MQTITFTSSKISVYQFADSVKITVTATEITTPEFIIGDMNSSNATLHKSVTPPADWQSWRYTFDGNSWTQVVGWTDPLVAEIATTEAKVVTLKAELAVNKKKTV